MRPPRHAPNALRKAGRALIGLRERRIVTTTLDPDQTPSSQIYVMRGALDALSRFRHAAEARPGATEVSRILTWSHAVLTSRSAEVPIATPNHSGSARKTRPIP